MSFESDLNRSVVIPIVLKLVAEQPIYGYEIIKLVNDRTRNELQWKQGTLYPCLHRMEDARLIRSAVRTTKTGREAVFYSFPGQRKNTAGNETPPVVPFFRCSQFPASLSYLGCRGLIERYVNKRTDPFSISILLRLSGSACG